MVVFYQQPNYERFQVASDECAIYSETVSLHRSKWLEQNRLPAMKVNSELTILRAIVAGKVHEGPCWQATPLS